jgi:hypothetical protein
VLHGAWTEKKYRLKTSPATIPAQTEYADRMTVFSRFLSSQDSTVRMV